MEVQTHVEVHSAELGEATGSKNSTTSTLATDLLKDWRSEEADGTDKRNTGWF